MLTQDDFMPRKQRARLLTQLKWFFLFSCGITEDSDQQLYANLYSFLLAVSVVVDLMAFYVGYKGTHMSFTEQIDSLYSAAGRIYLYLMYWCVKLNREPCLTVFSVLWKIRRNVEEFEAIMNAEQHFIKRAKIVFFTLVSILMISTTFPLCYNNVVTKSKNFNVLLFDHWLTCEHKDEFLLAVFCWNVESYWKYALKNVIQLSTMIVELLPLFTVVLFQIFMFINIEAHATIIKTQFETTRTISGKYAMIGKSNELARNLQKCGIQPFKRIQTYDRAIEQCILDLVKYQQHVYRMIGNMKPIVTSITNVSVGAGTMMMLLSVCFLRMQTGSYSYSQFRSVSGLLVIMFVLYLQCVVGQQISDLNVFLSHIVYNAPWYQFSTKMKTLVLRVMLLQQKALEIKALRAHVVNKRYGLWVLRMVYNTASLIIATIKI